MNDEGLDELTIQQIHSTNHQIIKSSNQQINLWSCRDSNPGPNKPPASFLHAYSNIGFRIQAGTGQPTCILSSFYLTWFQRFLPGQLYLLCAP
jgi:hypothetical protein